MPDSEQPLTREERLAAKLRENLKRRKAQARALTETEDPLPRSGRREVPGVGEDQTRPDPD